jgi:hypothetical protein
MTNTYLNRAAFGAVPASLKLYASSDGTRLSLDPKDQETGGVTIDMPLMYDGRGIFVLVPGGDSSAVAGLPQLLTP